MLAHPFQMKRIDNDCFDIFSRMLCEYIFERLANTCEYLQTLENGIQTYRSSYKRIANFSVFNTNIAQSPRVSPNGIKYHIFHYATKNSHISSSVMAEAVRQVATLATLDSQHAVVIHNAIVGLQQDRERQQQELVQRRRRLRRRQRSMFGEGLAVTR